MLNFEYKNCYDVNDLRGILKILRSEDGCPWDREQTHESIRRDLLEETYEAVEAIDENSPEHLREELGDVLLQVVFHACIEEEQGRFSLDDVADEVSKKLIYRHPHVFGDVKVSGSQEVLQNWDELKRLEKNQETTSDAIDAVARSLPALWRAEKIQKKAANDGFNHKSKDASLAFLLQISQKLTDAIKAGGGADELAALMFACVNLSRFLDKDPDMLLHSFCDGFAKAFREVEETSVNNGTSLSDMDSDIFALFSGKFDNNI